ncbi:ABC transporter ATP-binding protein [Advenella mimigardefordensis]|uniref:Putative glutathione import ATP-binding protein GsiA n=1 Tax=Advenella mimigardefordensis (strain DSM 17166 / LMG 22922 / DPN7) TaxID=1247726 RepID=W0PE11_ADVMD|nr:ABC transporter ATP-binding protein [Advenella mimigardefordensis]AHG65119.1 putative glutathione import ATP-binding protein GsiA [Advenella mimigardefordensis DPN7]
MNQDPMNNTANVVAPVLQVRDLSVQVAGADTQRRVVNNISFDVHAGETLCVVGESGSGKSVTSYTVMGLLGRDSLQPCNGSILLDGEDILQASASRLRELRATRMSMIFQEPMTALNPVQKVGRQIDEVLRIHRTMSAKQRRQAVLQMLESVHMPDPQRIYDAYPHQLSGGQRQRVVICMALILQPRLLIADEPTTALDVTTQKQILLLIRELQTRNNMAVLFITHDFGVVAEIADRIVVMNKGQVMETGTRDAILRDPAHAYSRMLVSSVPSLVPRQREPNNEEQVLKVSGLMKTYASKKLLGASRHITAANDINLTLNRGEIVGIVGESGSGKSTVARCIVRLLQPTAGQIRIKGQDIAGLSTSQLRPVRQRIQIVFQDPYRSLNPRITVGDSIIEGLLNFGVSKEVALVKAAELMQVVGLTKDALQRYPHQFSGGQRQRICIARALALEPDILVADEAVSALDVSVQAQVLALLDKVRERTGVGVLFITHDLRVAAQICDSIIVMQQGSIVESGKAHSVLTAPTQPYTRALIDAAPGRHWDFQHFRAVSEAVA